MGQLEVAVVVVLVSSHPLINALSCTDPATTDGENVPDDVSNNRNEFCWLFYSIHCSCLDRILSAATADI